MTLRCVWQEKRHVSISSDRPAPPHPPRSAGVWINHFLCVYFHLMQTYRFSSLTFLTSLTFPTQSLISCDDVYKWSRTTSSKPGDDYAWENTVYPEDTQPLLPSEASHTAALNAKNPFLKSTTVNSLAFVNAQADVSIKLETVGGAKSDPGLYAIHVSGLTSRKDATRFSVTCHNFGGFRQPRDACSKYNWGRSPVGCKNKFDALPKCKVVPNLVGAKIITNRWMGGAKYIYSRTFKAGFRDKAKIGNFDAGEAFFLAREKFQKHGSIFDEWDKSQLLNYGRYYVTHLPYTDALKRGTIFCDTKLYWDEVWLDGVRETLKKVSSANAPVSPK